MIIVKYVNGIGCHSNEIHYNGILPTALAVAVVMNMIMINHKDNQYIAPSV